MPRNFILEADGGSRGNPGPAGSGAAVIDLNTGELVAELGRYVGIATNNVAEYIALEIGLSKIFEIDPEATVEVRMDSKLVVEQMSGRWKIKHPDMQDLAINIKRLIGSRTVNFIWVPREQNSRADALANEAMDSAEDFSRVFDGGSESVVSPVNEQKLTQPSSIRAPQAENLPPTTVIMVRHGRTELTETNRISGRTGLNPGLSDLGQEDAQRAATELSNLGKRGFWKNINPPTVVISSPLQRTLDTAQIIAAKLGLKVEVVEDFAEISFGEWDGLTNEELFEKWPDEYQTWRGSWDVPPPNGESLADFDLRIRGALERTIEKHAGATVVVVAHVMPIRGVLRYSLGAGPETYWRPVVAPCSISAFRFWGSSAADLLNFNATSHLN